jgi:polyhydroxybutyrate depolymerase
VSTTPVAVPSPTAEPGVSGCDPVHPHAPGDFDETIQSGGIERTYVLHIPPEYDGRQALPLVLNFHGSGSSGRQQAAYSQFPAKADVEGFIVVSPDGTGQPRHWAIPTVDPVDDIAFVNDLLERLESQLCIDGSRIFGAGMSSGAAFSTRLACAIPERIVAIAPVTALVYPVTCPEGDPVAVIAFHGTHDFCVPFDGGVSRCGAGLPVPPIRQSARRWASRNVCNPEPAETQLTEHVLALTWSQCAANTSVILYVVEEGGHTWPGAIDVPGLGSTTHEINATDLIWEFFANQGALNSP